MKLKLLVIFLVVIACGSLFAQTHSSVSLENQVYYILEQAEIKGLCTPLSGSRPYTQSVVMGKIDEILDSGNTKRLNATERDILEQYREKFSKQKNGLDWQRAAWFNETSIGANDIPLSINIGATADIQGSTGIYSSGDKYFGTEIWLGFYAAGDLGRNVSYNFIFEGGLAQAPRQWLGEYHTYYKGYVAEGSWATGEYKDEIIQIYSEPLTHFPYTYKKRWDSSIFGFSNLAGYNAWPDSLAGGYNLPAELTASFLEDKLIARLGRISHEWGSASYGSSLALNQNARPFVGVEAEFFPVSWFGISSLTGVLEYYNGDGIKDSAETFQNAYSITMFQFRYKNYVFFDFIDAVVWPKRFELGYILPITSNFFYQNNIGDFDNMAMAFNLRLQYPGWGSIWGSFFVDEMNLLSDWNTLDRQMVAVQGGVSVPLPFLAFSSVKMSYTKVNPYCYTHNRNYNPWYGDLRMETAYTNNGVGLGYYLPPNSDEILVRVTTMPVKNINTYVQYQLIRHGADFGSSAVDGSNLLSELAPGDRNSDPVLKRYFLQDGAYQWMNIAKVGAEWNLPGLLPITLYGEAGVNYSYFTNIEAEANVTGKAHPYSVIDTAEYPKSTAFIAQVGFKVSSR